MPSCFIPPPSPAASLASPFHFISLCWLMLANLAHGPRLPSPPRLLLGPPPAHLRPPLPFSHPFSLTRLPFGSLSRHLCLHSTSSLLSPGCSPAVVLLFSLYPSYLSAPPPRPPFLYFTGGREGTAAGDRPAEITVLLLESIQAGTTPPGPVLCVCVCCCQGVCSGPLPEAETTDKQRRISLCHHWEKDRI